MRKKPETRHNRSGNSPPSAERPIASEDVATTRPPAEPRRRKPISRGRLWLFRLLALTLPIWGLAGTEFILRWRGVGIDSRLIIPVANRPTDDLFQFNPRADIPYCPRLELRGPEPQPFTLPKPQGVFRVVVLGESTVQGYPLPTEIAFPRHLKLLLEKQWPDRRVEVLNAGIVGINSFAIADLAEQALEAQPDLLIVYAGHNEFYGPGGVASTMLGNSPWLYRAMLPLRRSRLAQWLYGKDRYQPQKKPLTALLARDLAIAWDNPLVRKAERYYEANLRRIVNQAQQRHVPIVLCTPASNLRNQSPIHSVPRAEINAQQTQERDALLTRVEQQFDDASPTTDWDSQLQWIEQAQQLDPQFALTEFRRAQCLERLGRVDEAFAAYRQARDWDGCRFRSPSTFGQIVHSVARDSGAGVTVLDVEELLRQQAEGAAPGRDFFVEHVHYHVAGQWRLAQLLAQHVVEQVSGATWQSDLVPNDTARDETLGIIPEDDLVADYLASFVISDPPLSGAADARREEQFLKARIAARREQISDTRCAILDAMSGEEKTDDLVIGVAARLLDQDNYVEALSLFRAEVQRRPWNVRGMLGIAECFSQQHQRNEALRWVERAIRLHRVPPQDLLLYRDLVRRQASVQ